MRDLEQCRHTALLKLAFIEADVVTFVCLSLLHIAWDENLYLRPEIANTDFSFIIFFLQTLQESVAIGRNCLLQLVTFYSLTLYNQRVWNVLLSKQHGGLLKHSY